MHFFASWRNWRFFLSLLSFPASSSKSPPQRSGPSLPRSIQHATAATSAPTRPRCLGPWDGTLASTKPSACAAPLARFGLGCLREQATVDPFLTVISTTFASSTSRPALRCLSAWARSPPLPAWRGRPWRRPGPRYPPQPRFGLGPWIWWKESACPFLPVRSCCRDCDLPQWPRFQCTLVTPDCLSAALLPSSAGRGAAHDGQDSMVASKDQVPRPKVLGSKLQRQKPFGLTNGEADPATATNSHGYNIS